MKPELSAITGGGKSKTEFPDAMITLDGKMFTGKFDKWRLQEVQGGRSTRIVDVREATPEEVEKLRTEFSKSLRLQVAE